MCRILNVIAQISAGAEGPITEVVSTKVGSGKCAHVKCVVPIMYLGEFKTAFGECLMRFECPACGNARDHEMVREERTILRDGGPQDERLMPEGRCRQAIAYLEKRDTERYVWFVVRQSPELAPDYGASLGRSWTR